MTTSTSTPKAEEHGTLAGVLVPGGAAVALILGCNILHVLGPVALLGLVALALVAGAGTLGFIARSARGPRTRRTRTARKPRADRSSKTAPRTSPARPVSASTPKAAASKLAAVPSPRRGTPAAPERPAAKVPARGVDPRTGVFGRPAPATAQKPRIPAQGATGKTAAAKTTPTAKTPAGKKLSAKQGSAAKAPKARGGVLAAARRAAGLAPAGKAAAAKTGKPRSTTKATLKSPTGSATRTALRRATKGTVKAARWASPKLARSSAAAGRRIARMHRRARRVRLHHIGPNWWPHLNRLLAGILTPAMALGRKAMTRRRFADWIDLHRRLQPVHVQGIKAGPAPVHVRRIPHNPITSPAKESTVSHPAIDAATESVRNAFAAVNSSPADSMREYEQILLGLPELMTALGEGLRAFADVSQDEFKVDTTVPDMLGDGSNHAQELGSFLGELHGLYRQVHEKQIENYEEATPGSEKWDVRAND